MGEFTSPSWSSGRTAVRSSSRSNDFSDDDSVSVEPVRHHSTRHEEDSQRIAVLEPRQPRVVEEKQAPYRQIQKLITELSECYGVTVKQAPQCGLNKRSSPRPHFLEEAQFLREQVDGIRFPATVRYKDYQAKPSAEKPIVMKNERMSKGRQKYLIESDEQLDRLSRWMVSYGKPEEWLAQEFIETPGSAPCSFRVLVDCTGAVVASQINYGPPKNSKMPVKAVPQADDIVLDPSMLLESPSEYDLKARSIVSNRMLLNDDDTTIGGRITLNPLPVSHPCSLKEKRILDAHGLDAKEPALPQLPAEVSRVASGIGRALGIKNHRVQELVLGVDIVQKRDTDEYYVLEVNRRPSLVPLRDMLGSAHSVEEIEAWQWLINGALNRVAQMKD